ncbi:CU044_5270 family protein [Streptomyces sp. NPDC060209]|uniref:CU044_5270 family protein n=1 Tax=Streptomyces sp. NPDC060209 TaxID=3347073 RepID=UPI0036683B24
MRETDRVLQSLDPARDAVTPADERDLTSILSTPAQGTKARFRPSPRRRQRCLLVTGLATAAVAFALVVTNMWGTSPQPAYAVTPKALDFQAGGRPAEEVLEEIAQRLEGTAIDAPKGHTQRFVQESWSLSTRIDGVQVTSAIIPERRTTWKKPDGSERWTVRSLEPQFEDDTQRERWEEAGSVGDDPQEYSDSSGPADMSDPRNQDAPADPGAMKRWLNEGYESSGPGETFDSVSERLLDRRFSPTQTASLLRALKNTQGIRYRGNVEDRAGRVGAAFAVESRYGGLPKTQTLVFDPKNGKLLMYEEELTHDAGKLNVKPPAVVLYISYL